MPCFNCIAFGRNTYIATSIAGFCGGSCVAVAVGDGIVGSCVAVAVGEGIVGAGCLAHCGQGLRCIRRDQDGSSGVRYR